MILYILSWSVSLFFILIKGNLINHLLFRFLDVDLVVVIIAYLMVYYGETGTGIFAFGQGILIDIFSGGILGLFTLLYLIIFFSIKLGSRPLYLLSAGGQIIIVLLAVLLFSDILMFASSAIFSGLIAPIIFYFFNQTNRFLIEVSLES